MTVNLNKIKEEYEKEDLLNSIDYKISKVDIDFNKIKSTFIQNRLDDFYECKIVYNKEDFEEEIKQAKLYFTMMEVINTTKTYFELIHFMNHAFQNTIIDIFFNIFEIEIKNMNNIDDNKILAFYLKLFEKYLILTNKEINELLQ